jgi:hypothetical protein
MTNLMCGHFPASWPFAGVTARGRWADTTGDQLNVIVLREMVFVMRAFVMARRIVRAPELMPPHEIESREILEIFAIRKESTR